jgi:hypothetical protein
VSPTAPFSPFHYLDHVRRSVSHSVSHAPPRLSHRRSSPSTSFVTLSFSGLLELLSLPRSLNVHLPGDLHPRFTRSRGPGGKAQRKVESTRRRWRAPQCLACALGSLGAIAWFRSLLLCWLARGCRWLPHRLACLLVPPALMSLTRPIPPLLVSVVLSPSSSLSHTPVKHSPHKSVQKNKNEAETC